MARSEFRFNKKRKHYAYLHKNRGLKVENILITTKPYVKKHKKGKDKIVLYNIPLFCHPSCKKDGKFYVIPRNYLDEIGSFGLKMYKWNWNKNDKRKIKRLKRLRTKK